MMKLATTATSFQLPSRAAHGVTRKAGRDGRRVLTHSSSGPNTPRIKVAASADPQAARDAPVAASAGALTSTRRDAILLGVSSLGLVATSPTPADARTNKWTSAGGIEYYDAPVGKGDTTFDGDTIKITFTAHTYDVDTGKKLNTFDPFINGGGGSSMAKGFKLTLGGSNGDIIPGLNLAIVGGDGVEPMRQGGKRVVRIPPELAFGDKGHHCYLGLSDQCEVPPNAPVEIELAFMDFV